MIKISVLMPVYNAGLFLTEAIESILNQSFPDFELIIINDGSTDNSKKIILSYNDSRIRYIENEKNLKLIATLNKGIDLCNGKYIARMDADDISLPARFEKQVKFMDANPEVALCGTWFNAIGGSCNTVKYATDTDDIRMRLLHQTQFCHPTVFLRKDILIIKNYKYNPDFIHAEDYELFVRISEKNKVANIPEVLLNYRIHDTNISNTHKNIQTENTKRIIVNQFQKLKQGFSDEDYSLYLTFAYSEFSLFDKQKVKKLDELLTGLLYENEKVVFLPVERLKEYWSEKLFHVCYNVNDCVDIWNNSALYDKRKMTVLKKIKKIILK